MLYRIVNTGLSIVYQYMFCFTAGMTYFSASFSVVYCWFGCWAGRRELSGKAVLLRRHLPLEGSRRGLQPSLEQLIVQLFPILPGQAGAAALDGQGLSGVPLTGHEVLPRARKTGKSYPLMYQRKCN